MQDTNIPENKVIIIGGDHHNGLGLARIFGLNGKKVFAVVISDKKRSWMATSKFVEDYAIFKTEKEGFDFIFESFSNELRKPVLIPYSDGAALELDRRLDEFKDKFHVPSINGEQNKIASMMNKNAQYKWAMDNGINMAKSDVVDLNDESGLPNGFKYPIILKPVESAQGRKLDIAVCRSDKDFNASVDKLKAKKYKSIFIQNFMKIDYEIVIVGAIAGESDYVFAAYHVVRSWPKEGGTSSFSVTITDKIVLEKCSELLEKISCCGYVGTIDVEAFFINNEFFLNEINWRNSGGDFRLLSHGYYYAYWFYCSVCTGIPMASLWKTPENVYSMVEYTDIRHVVKGNVSLLKWCTDFFKAKNYSLVSFLDMKPVLFKVTVFFLH